MPRPEPHNPNLLYGRNAVIEALRGRRTPRRLWVAEGVKPEPRLQAAIAAATASGATVAHPPRLVLDQMTGGANHQGIVLDASPYPYAALDDIAANPGTVLVLDHLQNPQNFGTLLRAAEAAGVAGTIIPQDRSVSVTPAVVNASAGAVELMAICQTPNLARALDVLKDAGWWVAGLDSGTDAQDLFGADLPSPIALVVGAEGDGIGPNVRRRCDLIVSLPMRGRIASLNAATAGAIALFELLRRQDPPPAPDR